MITEREIWHHAQKMAKCSETGQSENYFLTPPAVSTKFRPPQQQFYVMATAQVILKEKIEGLGAESDVVKVRAGYA
ncbi:MAG: Ribosomal protein N-terminal domain, partial [Verrucomicrobiota bacterium]